jgi:hypothetical protein
MCVIRRTRKLRTNNTQRERQGKSFLKCSHRITITYSTYIKNIWYSVDSTDKVQADSLGNTQNAYVRITKDLPEKQHFCYQLHYDIKLYSLCGKAQEHALYSIWNLVYSRSAFDTLYTILWHKHVIFNALQKLWLYSVTLLCVEESLLQSLCCIIPAITSLHVYTFAQYQLCISTANTFKLRSGW